MVYLFTPCRTSDFTGWSKTGKVEIETADFGAKPAEGTYYAALSTMFDTVSDSDLESFLEDVLKGLTWVLKTTLVGDYVASNLHSVVVAPQ